MELEAVWNDEIAKLQIMIDANCEWICNLDKKDILSKEELELSEKCYSKCILKQKEANKELEDIKIGLNKKKINILKNVL